MTSTARNRVRIVGGPRVLAAASTSALAITGFRGISGSLVAFAHTLVGGLLLGPLRGPIVGSFASKEKELVR